MPLTTPPPVPMRSVVVDAITGWFTRDIVRFLNELRGLISAAAQVIGSVSLTGQSASIPATDIPTPSLTAGVYRVSYALHVTRAGTTSSSAAVTFDWTFNSTSCSQAFTAVTGNTLASQTSDDISVMVDAGTPLQYSVTYASVGATSMQYALAVWVEAVGI